MVSRAIGDRLRKKFCTTRARLHASGGNVLVYIIVVMLIFAVLGVAMVSLFSTSISSSATANEQRRAFYLSESGLRYGMSELRKENGFSTANIATLNNTEYKVPPSGSFDIAVFGAWFFSPLEPWLNSKLFAPDGEVPLQVGKGKLPSAFFDKNLPEAVPDLFIVAVGNDLSLPDAVAKVKGFSNTPGDYTSFKFIVADDFRVSKEIPKTERGKVGMAFHPLENGTFTPSGDSTAYLDLPKSALNIFPKTNGSFMFRGDIYFYKTAKDEGDRFRLYNITARKGVEVSTKPIDKSTDYIILDYNNYLITSKGISGNITYGGGLDHAVSFREGNGNRLPDLNPTIADMQQIETDGNYISGGVDAKGDFMQIGGVGGSNFGAMWFKETVNFGGSTDYCTSGKCFFENGLRVFFTLEYSGSGDGLIFALLNGQLNQLASVGGDFEAPELLGYAGDSRLNNSGSFLDTSGIKGLRPPKMGLEFDTKRNWDQAFETKPVNFCSGSSLRQNTRNDPDPSSSAKDYVQYVYWGANSLTAPCRGTNAYLYDDNRHDPAGTATEDWPLTLSGVVNTSPAISSDGKTIYVGSNNTDINPATGWLYAIDLDSDGYPKTGSETPFFSWSNGVTSPVLGSDGTIYIGSGHALYAFTPSKSPKSGFPVNLPFGNRTTKPVIASDGTIYIASNDGVKFGYLYAIKPDGSFKASWGAQPKTIQFFFTYPVLSRDESLVYAAAIPGNVYALKTSDGTPDLSWGITGKSPGGNINTAPAVGPSGTTTKGTVYVGTSDKNVYALNGNDGSTLWTSIGLAALESYSSSPVVGPNGTVYIGNYDDHLYAIIQNPSNPAQGILLWKYYAVGNVQSTPFIDSSNTIYFGSDIRDPSIDSRNVYALYSDGTEKWRFQTSSDVRGTPAVKPDGVVYVGSNNFNFYAINQFATPKSLKNKYISYDGTAVGSVPVTIDAGNSDDWLRGSASKGPWAVRMEVYRSLDPNTTAPVGFYRYELRSWVRQCEQADCTDVLGTFFDDTRVSYSPILRPPQMEQTIFLSGSSFGINGDHDNFYQFLFGFTSQTASSDSQTSTIRQLKLSFVRQTDATIICDPTWPDGTTCP